MPAALLINGVDAETYGFTLAEAPGWSDMPARAVVTAPVIGRQGVKDLADPQEQPRKLSLSGTLRGTSVADARTKLDALKIAFAAKTIQFVFADQSTRFVTGRLDSFNSPPLVGSMVQSTLHVDATFVCTDPYFYDALLAGVFINYSPGDTITGETFTRASTAYQLNAAGVYEQKAINVKRDGHYIGGVRSLLLEGARTNSVLRSNDLTNAAWTTGATGVASQSAVGLDGSANSATFLNDTDGAAFYVKSQSFVVPNDNSTHTVAAWILKDSNVTRFPQVKLVLSGGTVVQRAISLNTQTGATGVNNSAGTGTVRVIDGGLWWILEITVTNNITGNTTLQVACYPAAGTALGVDNAAATGTTTFGQVQVELFSLFSSSPIFTAGATVTRAADSYSAPFYAVPQEMSAYVKSVELGTFAAAAAQMSITTSGNATPQFRIFSGAGYLVHHFNTAGAGVVVSSLAGGPTKGDTVELSGRLFSDGSVDITQSLNSGAPTSGAQSAPLLPLAAAWAAQLVWLNSIGNGNVGFIAIQSFKIAAKSRTLDEMRALVRMPLGTAVVRPLVRINGVSVNPVITLYNKAGVAMASITLTITTIAGDILEIDMDAKTVKKNGVSQIATISAGDFFSIDPADQTNFGAPGPSINSSSGAVTVEYRRAWR
jgi:phage-related protein